jgi:DNA polymerase-3 subunit alpha
VNYSDVFFTPTPAGIRFGLTAIKNVGENAIVSIVAGKPFKSLFDFCERVDLRAVNKRVLESLIKSGAFDSVNANRSLLYNNIDRAAEWGQRKQRENEVGQGGLFGMMMGGVAGGDGGEGSGEHPMDPAEPWNESLKLKHEKETLGFYITGHPLRKFADEVRAYGNATTGTLSEKPSGFEVSIGGIVSAIRVMRTKKGDAMAIVQLEDWEGIVEVLMFPDTYAKVQRLLEADAALIVKGKLDNDEASMKILATDVYPMERAREILSKTVTIQINATTCPPDLPDQLQPIIDRKKGHAEIVFALNYPGKSTVFVRPNPYVKVLPDRELIEFTERLCGPGSVSLQ